MITGLLFLLAFLCSIAIIALIPLMERFHHFSYSEIKPVVRFARDHWSNPEIHTPWQGFEDLKVDVKHQLRAVRRQVVNIAAFHMEQHGYTSSTIVPKLESTLFPQDRRDH